MATISEIIKKELNLEKLADKEKKDKWVGDISLEKIKEIAKKVDIPGNTEEAKIRQIIGSCISYRITINGKDPREFKNFGKE